MYCNMYIMHYNNALHKRYKNSAVFCLCDNEYVNNLFMWQCLGCGDTLSIYYTKIHIVRTTDKGS